MVSMAPGTTLGFATGNFTLTNNFQISGDPSFVPPTGTTQTIAGVISDGGAPGVVEMNGAGTLVFSGANTYSGGTVINSGTLQLSGAGTLGAASGATTINAGATLDLGTTTQIQNGGLTLAGGTIQNGTLSSSTGFILQSGSASAVLSGSGGVTKTTTGTVSLTGAKTYSGGTVLNSGTLQLSGAGTLGVTSSATTINAGATLDLGDHDSYPEWRPDACRRHHPKRHVVVKQWVCASVRNCECRPVWPKWGDQDHVRYSQPHGR